ncbi:MAG: hypothetical protein WCF39_03605 [Pseudolabrys sp.]|jgi:hypothetical protein
MHRSEAQAEAKYGATFCLALQRISNNRNFPQAKHDSTAAASTSVKDNPTRQTMAHWNTRMANL